jgi:hypothetical protein
MRLQEDCRVSADTGWLIEHPHDPRYGRESWYSGKDGFTIDSLQAVRFARKEDAEREIDRFPTSLAKRLVAEQHAWIPAAVCPHGQLRRQCETCEAHEQTAPLIKARTPYVFEAKAIHTGNGPGLIVETRVLNGVETFTLTHLGTAGCIPVGLDGAKALWALLGDWIEQREAALP